MAGERSADSPVVKSTNGVDPGEEAVFALSVVSRISENWMLFALTHAHQDHAGGASLQSWKNFQVGRVWIRREVSSRALLRLEELAREQKIPIEHELRGKTIHWDGRGGRLFVARDRP